MKNTHSFIRFLIFFYATFLYISSVSQTTPKGYEINYKSFDKGTPYLYLTGIYGNESYMVDSAKFAKNQYLFKNKKKILPSGFYTIESQKENGTSRFIHAEFIVDQTRNFTIDDTGTSLLFNNSEENRVFLNFKQDLLDGNDLSVYYETAPESLLGKYVRAQYIPVRIPEFFWGSHEGRVAAAQKYHTFVKEHYFDNVDFKDVRLMYTPLDIDLKEFFINILYPQTADNVLTSIENLFYRILDKNPAQEQLDMNDIYLKKLIHLYMNADPKFDTVFVYLVDNYVNKTNSKFITDSERDLFKRIADRKRKTLIGETIPVFESYTKDYKLISTADIDANYTILWFWDPDCEHCMEETPKLCEFYSKYHELYNFEVIACSVTDDYDRWFAFIHEHHLEWINTSYAVAEPNYDATDFFGFNETPAIFIIDKQQKIVARQFPLDDLPEVFESLKH